MERTVVIESQPINSRQFAISVKRLANSLTFGMEASIFHGAGIEYAQSRLYVAGDPVKFIDWKITARTGKYYIKEYQEPKRMPVYILLDTSASMCISSLPMSKYAWAVMIGTGLALAAQTHMSPVGLLGCGERKIKINPTLSGNIVMEWAHSLRKHGFLEGTSMGSRIRELLPSLKTRTQLIAISDLHDEAAIHALKLAGQEHDCSVIHLQDPAELSMKGSGFFRGQEAETGKTFTGHGWKKWDISERARSELTRSGVDYLRLRTDEKILGKLRLFMTVHGKGGAGGR